MAETVEGGLLMELVGNILNDKDIIAISFEDNIITTEHYKPDGSCADYKYVIERIEDKKKNGI